MRQQVRRPGQPFDLTDEELLTAPARFLTKAQRMRRRKLKKEASAKNRQNARRKRIEQGKAKVIFCQGFTKRGDPCGSYAVTGAKHCNSHLNDAEKAKLGRTERGKRGHPLDPAKKQSPPQLMRQVMEVAAEKLLSRYFDALGFELAGFDEQNNPVVYDHGALRGVRLYGESKEGDICVSDYPDLAAQVQIIEKLMDRVFGKPRQTQVIEGGTRPIQVQPVKSADRAQRVAQMLQQSGAVPRANPHEGRRRPQPPGETSSEKHASVESARPHVVRDDEGGDAAQ